MPKNSEVVEKLNEIEAGSLTVAAYREMLTEKHRGRKPADYDFLQKRINEVAPTINPKHWRGFSFAAAVYESCLLGGVKCQKPAQINNLIKAGHLVLPPAPPIVEKVKV